MAYQYFQPGATIYSNFKFDPYQMNQNQVIARPLSSNPSRRKGYLTDTQKQCGETCDNNSKNYTY